MSKIKSVSAYSYSIETPEQEERYISSYIEYDKAGNVILAISYLPDGEIESKTTSEYNQKGHLIRQSNYISEDEIGEDSVYIRNENGDLIRVDKKFADGSASTITHNRSEDSKQLEISNRDEDGELEEREVYLFDDKGNMLEKEVYNYNNKLQEKYVNEYDEKANLVKQTEYEQGGRFALETELTYDDNGNVISQITFNRKRQITHKLLFTYDDKNRVIRQQFGKSYVVKTVYNDEDNTRVEKKIGANGIEEDETVSKYNENGDILEESDGFNITKYEYNFFDEE